jgi:preprotein translocase subunit Sec63
MVILIRFVLMAVVIWLTLRTLLKVLRAQRNRTYQSNGGFNRSKSNSLDPYQVLGISPNSNKKEIKSAYLNRLSEYHPDKVAHLGKDLRDLADQRTRAILEAYNKLKDR